MNCEKLNIEYSLFLIIELLESNVEHVQSNIKSRPLLSTYGVGLLVVGHDPPNLDLDMKIFSLKVSILKLGFNFT